MSAHTIIRRTGLVLASAALAGVLLPVQAQSSLSSKDKGNRVVRIVANGSDGEVGYYAVRCADGRRGDVRLEHDTELTCAVPQHRDARCKAKWSIQQAGEHVCSASGR